MSKGTMAAALAIFVATTTLWVCSPKAVSAADEEVDVIVNKTNTVGDLPLGDAKKIFMSDKTSWPSGKRITVLMLGQGQPERDVVLHQIYKMSDADYNKYFADAVFTGRVVAQPKDIASSTQMKQEVAANSGAIGYIKSTDVDDSIKVVLKLTK